MLFRCDLKEEEIEVVTSVIGAMIFSKEPPNNNVLIMLLGVKSQNMLYFVQKSLVFIINKGSILHFHYYSFENFLLSSLFKQELNTLSAVQDREHHECQFAILCLKTMASPEPYLNICSLKTLDMKN